MASPVEQLQADALDQSIKVATLLRRVKLIAAKLKLSETVEWAQAELNGYRDDIDDARVPAYRRVMGQVKAYSPYHGWQPPAGDSRVIDLLSKRAMGDSISALEDLADREAGDTLVMLISNDLKQKVLKGNPGWSDMHTEIPRSAIVGVIDHVRNMVLDWAIELEGKGITGEGVTFSPHEREQAAAAHINIQNFQGNLNAGDVAGTGNRINIGSTDNSRNVIAKTLFSEIEKAISEGVQEDGARQQLMSNVAEMRKELGKPAFIKVYQKFIGLAADHLSLLGPFLPALGGLISFAS